MNSMKIYKLLVSSQYKCFFCDVKIKINFKIN